MIIEKIGGLMNKKPRALQICPDCKKRGVTQNNQYYSPFYHCRYCHQHWWQAAWNEVLSAREGRRGR